MWKPWITSLVLVLVACEAPSAAPPIDADGGIDDDKRGDTLLRWSGVSTSCRGIARSLTTVAYSGSISLLYALPQDTQRCTVTGTIHVPAGTGLDSVDQVVQGWVGTRGDVPEGTVANGRLRYRGLIRGLQTTSADARVATSDGSVAKSWTTSLSSLRSELCRSRTHSVALPFRIEVDLTPASAQDDVQIDSIDWQLSATRCR